MELKNIKTSTILELADYYFNKIITKNEFNFLNKVAYSNNGFNFAIITEKEESKIKKIINKISKTNTLPEGLNG